MSSTTSARPVARTLSRPTWLRSQRSVLGVVVALEALIHLHFVHTSWFAQDDLFNFNDSLRRGLTLDFLREPLFGHFVPGHHLADWFLQRAFPLNFGVALAILGVFWAASVYLLHALAEELAGRSWWNVALASAFGLFIAFVPSLQWWTAGLLSLPSICLGLLCMLCFLRNARTGSTLALVGAIAAFAASLLFYEKAVFVVGYLLLIRFLLSGEKPTGRHLLNVLRQQWVGWVALVAISAVYLWNYRANVFDPGTPMATGGHLVEYFRIVWLRGFGPAAMNLSFLNGAAPATNVAVVLAQVLEIAVGVWLAWRFRRRPVVWVALAAGIVVWCAVAGTPDPSRWGPGFGAATPDVAAANAQVAILGAVVASIVIDRRAWRAWVFFALAFAVNALVIGSSRVEDFGTGIGYDIRYFPEMGYLLAITLAVAFRPHGRSAATAARGSRPAETAATAEASGRPATAEASGRRPASTAGPAGGNPRAEGLVPASGGNPRAEGLVPAPGGTPRGKGLIVVFLVAGALAYVLGYWGTATQIQKAWPAQHGRAIYDTLRTSLAKAQATAGQNITLINGPVPEDIVPSWLAPWNRVSSVLPAVDAHLTYNQPGALALAVAPDGALKRVAFAPLAGGSLRADQRSRFLTGPPSLRKTGCMTTAPNIPGAFVLTPRHPIAAGSFVFVRLTGTVDHPVALNLFGNAGAGEPAVPNGTLTMRPGRPVGFGDVGGPQLASVRVELPGASRLCLTRAELGTFR